VPEEDMTAVAGETHGSLSNAAKPKAHADQDAVHAMGSTEHPATHDHSGQHPHPPPRQRETVTVRGLAQTPKSYPWRKNPEALTRTLDEVKRIALEHGVNIPDDIAIFAVNAKWLPPESYATYMGRDFAPGQRVSWQEFYNKHDNIAVKISKDILDSDEAIVAVMAHEMHELNGLRNVFERRQTIPAEELGRMINPGHRGNLHDQAWDVADSLVAKMRTGAAND